MEKAHCYNIIYYLISVKLNFLHQLIDPALSENDDLVNPEHVYS